LSSELFIKMMFVYSRVLVIASLVAAVAANGQFAENSCPPTEWLPLSDAGLPGNQIRCCKGDYTTSNQVQYGSCQTSSCRENFGQKNLNCHNYGSEQHPITASYSTAEGNEPGGNKQGGSAICPYLKKDRAICDVSSYTLYNGGDNCRKNPNDNHCLGKVKCQSKGITDGTSGWNARSDGTDTARGGTSSNGGDCTHTEWNNKLCFYDGTSENWKVCDGPFDAPCDWPCSVGGFGDPHVLTWSGEHFEYMGECDLVLVDSHKFGDGLGFTAHMRTKALRDYSYIEAASIKIGDDILEVGSYGDYFYNGVNGADMTGATLSGFPIVYEPKNKKEQLFHINLGESGVVTLKSYTYLVSIKFDAVTGEDFEDSVGLMGDFYDGLHLGRDGKTIMEDINEYGQEWQVLPTEPMLFDTPPPAGKCSLPDMLVIAAQKEKRRLGEGISVHDAELACDQYPKGSGFEECVHDVIATGDLDVANAGAF